VSVVNSLPAPRACQTDGLVISRYSGWRALRINCLEAFCRG